MAKRGRKSTAELATAPVELDAKRQRPPAPDGLDEAERAIWKRVVSAMPGGWFGPEHREMLTRYCEHQCRAERFSKVARKLITRDDLTRDDIDDLDKCCRMAERESRAALALARSMRITHQAQLRAETASTRRQNTTATPPPWWSSNYEGEAGDD